MNKKIENVFEKDLSQIDNIYLVFSSEEYLLDKFENKFKEKFVDEEIKDFNLTYIREEDNVFNWKYSDTFPTDTYSQYFKYNISMSTNDTSFTPEISSVDITYDKKINDSFRVRKTNQSKINNGSLNWITYDFIGFPSFQTFKWGVKLLQSDGQEVFSENRTFVLSPLKLNYPHKGEIFSNSSIEFLLFFSDGLPKTRVIIYS